MRCRLGHCRLVVTTLACIFATGVAHAQGSAAWVPQVLGTQVTVIAQRLGQFDAAYSGPMSLVAAGDRAVSHTYGIYLGSRLFAGVDGYLDVEMARGSGISHASGLAGVGGEST